MAGLMDNGPGESCQASEGSSWADPAETWKPKPWERDLVGDLGQTGTFESGTHRRGACTRGTH
jgi:hypothetical protein